VFAYFKFPPVVVNQAAGGFLPRLKEIASDLVICLNLYSPGIIVNQAIIGGFYLQTFVSLDCKPIKHNNMTLTEIKTEALVYQNKCLNKDH